MVATGKHALADGARVVAAVGQHQPALTLDAAAGRVQERQ